MTKAPALLPEGLRDRLPQQAEAASRVTRALVDAMRSHGYGRVAPPLAEFRETLGGDDERSARDLLRFTDPVSQRTLALRPDITRQVGRIATSLLAHAPRPLRLCYAGQVVKLRASQLRPAREMLQVGAELIGSDSVAAAREIVTVAIDALEAAGIGPVTIDFTLPDVVDLLAGGPLPVDADIQQLRDELDAKDAGALVRLGAETYLPLLRATGPFDRAIADLRAFDVAGVLTSRIEALEAIAAPVRGRADLTLDPTERHGFAYQSWFGFQIFVPGQGDAIGRGGAYAIPVGEDREEPAVGFSLYPDPLIDAGLGGEDIAERRIFLPIGHDPAIAASLRADGWQTVAALTDAEDAARLGCGWVLGSEGPIEA
ncbi:ATP phosphoribosyltransferase regulatory subunit [Sphingopyxis sp. GW247-27LB]|uniref:ATP phosphoribosyltransferase regulatory subunit n=1 Tax=Sphingopyxis sp. GW247-27LB TaxID=2012632 RepID=UPI000BA4ED61|nr:ATP phosphoribosyltransferase regulatory subunit [Sphingopyxis sp. GW247-27LB]PAL22538.1 ATP phosphoribosyltransferase regulatory subunit [Sphingopyxis sp. GW247-27LB]